MELLSASPGYKTELSLLFLAKDKIMLIKDVKRNRIEFITKILDCLPIANIERFHEDKVGYADVVEKVSARDGIRDTGRTPTVFFRGSNQLVIDE
ncbi:T-complex protein 1 subunit delta [Hordeum vulgare]|nr:T-complex protein 1 subunit delta [Hordeum vulgare]